MWYARPAIAISKRCNSTARFVRNVDDNTTVLRQWEGVILLSDDLKTSEGTYEATEKTIRRKSSGIL